MHLRACVRVYSGHIIVDASSFCLPCVISFALQGWKPENPCEVSVLDLQRYKWLVTALRAFFSRCRLLWLMHH